MSITSTASPSPKLINTTPTPDVVWGAQAIGEVINRTEKQIFHLMPTLMEAGAVRKVNSRWVGNVRKLLAFVGGE